MLDYNNIYDIQINFNSSILRNIICDFIFNNRKQYIDFYDCEKSIYIDKCIEFTGLIDFYRNDNVWDNNIGDIIPKCLSDLLEIPIFIYDKDIKNVVKINEHFNKYPIKIILSEYHYTSCFNI